MHIKHCGRMVGWLDAWMHLMYSNVSECILTKNSFQYFFLVCFFVVVAGFISFCFQIGLEYALFFLVAAGNKPKQKTR